jgi:uncharacterized RDD family membrane protein YckC
MRFFRRKTRPSPDAILSPEGVALTLRVAGVGVRLTAQIADVLVTATAAGCVLFLLAISGLTEPQTLMGVAALLFFFIRIPYYAVTELLWNGQTLGKRMMKIKVIAHDGRSLTTHAIVLRNLMKEAEIFLPGSLVLTLDAASPILSLAAFAWVVMAFVIPLTNPYRQRLGDLLAGTHVIHLPQPILLRDLAKQALQGTEDGPRIIFLSHQLDHYGAFELQTLEGLLRVDLATLSSPARTSHNRTLADIIEKIRRKIGYADPVDPADHMAFLQTFYTAQRAHLEQRQLFGDRRADKHHAAGTET